MLSDQCRKFCLEQIGMTSGSDKCYKPDFICLFPNEKPVWLDVTFPKSGIIARKLVGFEFRRKIAFCYQKCNRFIKNFQIQPSFF